MNSLIIAIEFTIMIIYIGYLVQSYSSKSVPVYVKMLVFISWIITFGFIFLLPLDLYDVFLNK